MTSFSREVRLVFFYPPLCKQPDFSYTRIPATKSVSQVIWGIDIKENTYLKELLFLRYKVAKLLHPCVLRHQRSSAKKNVFGFPLRLLVPKHTSPSRPGCQTIVCLSSSGTAHRFLFSLFLFIIHFLILRFLLDSK